MYLDYQGVKNRHNDFLKEAAQDRLARKLMANQPSMRIKAQNAYQMTANRIEQQLEALDKAVSLVLSGSRNSF